MHMFLYTVIMDGTGRSKVNPNADDRPIILIYTFTEARPFDVRGKVIGRNILRKGQEVGMKV